MSRLDDIKEHFRTYETDTTNPSYDDVYDAICYYEEDIKRINKSFRDEISANNTCKFIANFLNLFAFIFGYSYDVNSFEDDNEILEREILVGEQFYKYFEKLNQIMNFDNYTEIYKIVEFTSDYYLDNCKFLDEERKRYDYINQGISVIFPGNNHDTSEDFDLFFEELIVNQLADIISNGVMFEE